MSSVVSAATKTFAPVAEAVWDFGSDVVSGATALFTGGSQAAAEAGGTVLGDVVTDAVVNAGLGAGAGALTSWATGGDVGSGALWGAGIGGGLSLAGDALNALSNTSGMVSESVSSGVTENPGSAGPVSPGGMNTDGRAGPVVSPGGMNTDGRAGPISPGGSSSPDVPLPSGGGMVDSVSTDPVRRASVDPGLSENVTSSAPIRTSTAGNQGAASGLGKFLSSETGGNLIAGLGQGYAGYAQAEAAKERQRMADQAALARDRKAYERTSGNYRSGGRGLLPGGSRPATQPQTAARPAARYRYNRQTGQIEFT
jgi:hypothetical protein